MTRKWWAIAVVVCLAVSLVGCATEGGYYSPERSAGAGALGGAATGAALGSIIGAATGSPATGAWVGAATGGLLGGIGGYLYAEHRNSETRSAQAAAMANNYSGQGNVVTVDSASANPSVVRPGQTVSLGMTYTILTPSNVPEPVSLVREVRVNGQMVGTPYQTTVNNANGTYSDYINYVLPNNATRGTYVVTNRVVSNAGTALRDSVFTVQ
jgi:predicted lipid-binding transport protein (Tim44 family)